MKSIDLREVSKQYQGLWVALDKAYKVIAANKSVRKVVDEAKKEGYSKLTLFKVPKEDSAFIGSVSLYGRKHP